LNIKRQKREKAPHPLVASKEKGNDYYKVNSFLPLSTTEPTGDTTDRFFTFTRFFQREGMQLELRWTRGVPLLYHAAVNEEPEGLMNCSFIETDVPSG